MSPLLELRGVTKIYRRGLFGRHATTALADVSLWFQTIRRGL